MPQLPPGYLDSVALFAAPEDGLLQYSATGFFCRHRTGVADSFDGLFLVTTAAAVGGNLADLTLLCRRRRGKRPRFYPATGEGGLGLGTWITESKRGLAMLLVDRERLAADGVRFREFDADYSALSANDMKERRLAEGDDVRILGFAPASPRIPLATMVRKGMIARIRDCYHGRSDTFLLDATIAEANRGSPVIVRLDRSADGRPLARPAIRLIGVVGGYLPSQNPPMRVGDDGKTLLVQPHTGLVQVIPVNDLLNLLETAARIAGA